MKIEVSVRFLRSFRQMRTVLQIRPRWVRHWEADSIVKWTTDNK